MPVYFVVDRASGAEAYRYTHDVPLDFAEFPSSSFDHIEAVEPETPPAPVVPVRITLLAFRMRFAQEEKVGLELATLHNATLAIDHPSNLLAARLRASMADQRDAEFIDLNDPDTRAGVLMLEQAGLLANGRAVEILDTPPTDDEVFNG